MAIPLVIPIHQTTTENLDIWLYFGVDFQKHWWQNFGGLAQQTESPPTTFSNPKHYPLQKRKFENVSTRHTTDSGSSGPSVSVTETTSVDEFLTNAEAAQKSFEAERGTARFEIISNFFARFI